MIEVALTGHDDFTFEFGCRICRHAFNRLDEAYYVFERPTLRQPRSAGWFLHRSCLNDRRMREIFGTAEVTLMAATRLFVDLFRQCPPAPREPTPPGRSRESILAWAHRNGGVKVHL
jgi:hypothetical protein